MQNNKVENKPHKINYLPLLSHVWIVQLFFQVLYLLILLFSYFPTENKQGKKLQTQIEIVRFLSRENVFQAGLDHTTLILQYVTFAQCQLRTNLIWLTMSHKAFHNLGEKTDFFRCIILHCVNKIKAIYGKSCLNKVEPH